MKRPGNLTYSTADGAEGHQALGVVGVAPTPGIPPWVFSPFQDKLLPTEAGVLITDPAAMTEHSSIGPPGAAPGLELVPQTQAGGEAGRPALASCTIVCVPQGEGAQKIPVGSLAARREVRPGVALASLHNPEVCLAEAVASPGLGA